MDQSETVRDPRATRDQLDSFITPYSDTGLREGYRSIATNTATNALFRNRAALDLFSSSARVTMARYGRGDQIADLVTDASEVAADWQLFIDTVRSDIAGEGLAVTADPASSRATYLTHLWAYSLPVLLGNGHISEALIESHLFVGQDALLDALNSVPCDNRQASESLLYPNPYAHLVAAMTASPEAGADHVRLFLDTWFRSVWKKSGWGDTHLTVEDDFPRYFGYWAVEAAAVVALRGIDDSSFRENEYYPSDLVRFYRGGAPSKRSSLVGSPSLAEASPSSLAEASPSLVLRVVGRDARAVTELELGLADQTAGLAEVSWLTPEHGVSALYELDSGRTVQVSAEQLQEWGTLLDEIISEALLNGPGRDLENVERLGDGCYVVYDEQMVASVLLRPGMLDRFAVSGKPVVMVPATGVLLIAGDKDSVALDTMLALAGEVLERGENLVTIVPVLRDGEHWAPFEWSRVPSLAEKASVLKRRWTESLYEWQQPLLRELYRRDGVDRFVASLSTVQPADGGDVFSYTSWTEGVEAVLPKADVVVFIADGAPPARATWEAAARAARGQLDPLGMRPERYKVTKFPTPRSIKRIELP